MPTPITPVASFDAPLTVSGTDTPSAAGMLEVLQSHANRAQWCSEHLVDGVSGGTFAPFAAISIGGAGVNLEGSSHYIEGKLSVLVGASLDVQSGGFVTVLAGGVVKSDNDRIILNGAGTLQVGSSGLLEVLSGGGLALRAGSVTTSYGEAYFAGTTEFLSGGLVTFRSGGMVDVRCTFSVGASGASPELGSISFNGAAGFAGGYASFVGPDCFDFGSTATGRINGILIKQVAGRITHRIVAGSNPGFGATQVYSPADADTIIADGLTGAPIYELSASALHGDRITIVNRDTVDAITVAASVALFLPFGTTPCKLLNATGNRYSATFEYSDGTGSRPTLGWYLVQEVRVP